MHLVEASLFDLSPARPRSGNISSRGPHGHVESDQPPHEARQWRVHGAFGGRRIGMRAPRV